MTAVAEEQRRVQALFDAEWEAQDDQDLTMENEEKNSEKTKELAREIRRARKETIMMASKSAGAAEEEKASHFPNGYQEIPLVGGGIYRGYIKDGAFHGQGELRFSNGDVYEGEFKKDMRDGHGIFQTKDQTVIRGNNNTSTSVGEKKNFTLLRYTGPWVEDRREGEWGIAAYSNGDTYEGPFLANRPDTTKSKAINGESALPSDAELVYYLKNGELPPNAASASLSITTAPARDANSDNNKKDTPTGKLPTYQFADGRVYVGEFKHYTREGRGALRTKTGDIWVGTFVNNLLHGSGSIKYSEASAVHSKPTATAKNAGGGNTAPGKMKKFEGIFRYGKRVEGRLTYTDGKIYDGQWDPETEKPHGKGSCRLRCGDIYVGEWRKGKMHGRGRITYTGANEGKYYDGDWLDDKPHGRGTMLMPTGVMVECLWDQGKQVQAADQEAKIAAWAEIIKTDKTSSFAKSAHSLEDRIARWKVPLIRKTNCKVEDLPSLDWYTYAADDETSKTSNKKSTNKKATTKQKSTTKAEEDAEDINLDDDEDIDLDAVLSSSPQRESMDAVKKQQSNDSAADEDSDDDGEEQKWEYFAQVEQPAEEAGPSDNEHNAFLRALRQKGFVPELLGNAADYDSDEERATDDAKKQQADQQAAAQKDTSWFTDEAPATKKQPANGGQPKSATGTSANKPQSNNPSSAAATSSQPSTFEAAELNNNDCVVGGQALHRGWMEKYSIGKSLFGFGGWKRRYFTLLLLKSPVKGRPDTGALLYYADEECNKHLGTVSLSRGASSSGQAAAQGGQPSSATTEPILYTCPTKNIHKKADRPDLDLVVEYSEEGKRYKLLLRTSTPKEHDQWVMYLSRIIKHRQ